MWIFTQDGFFSAVKASPNDPRNKVGPDALAVRARRKQHLVNLKKRYPKLLGKAVVLRSDQTDYRWRLFVTRRAWSQVVAGLVLNLTYGNFKGSIPNFPGAAEYRNRLHDVWDVMYGTQLSEEAKPAASKPAPIPRGSAGGRDPMLGLLGVRRRPPEEDGLF